MPAISISSSIIPDFKESFRSKTPSFSLPKSPKAAKRFFGFPSSPGEGSPPVPPLPSVTSHHQPTSSISSTTSLATPPAGFQGATIVRTPQEALEGIKSLTPPVLPQLPIAHSYTNSSGKKFSTFPQHSSSTSLDRGKYTPGTIQTDQSNKIYRSQSATEELRSPISKSNGINSNPPTPATAPPPFRSGIVGIKGVLKSPSYDYLSNNNSNNDNLNDNENKNDNLNLNSADNWAREVLGSIRISTDLKPTNTRSSITESKLGSIFGLNSYKAPQSENGDLNSFIESYGSKYDSSNTLKPNSKLNQSSIISLSSSTTFGHDENSNLDLNKFKGYQPSFASTSSTIQEDDQQQHQQHQQHQQEGYSEDQYKPYNQPQPENFSAQSSQISMSTMMLEEERYPPRSSSTLQHLEEVKFTPVPTPTYHHHHTPLSYSSSIKSSNSNSSSSSSHSHKTSLIQTSIEEEYDDTSYDPFKKIEHYPSTSSVSRRSTRSNSTTTATTTVAATVKENEVQQKQQKQDKLIPFTIPTYPKADPVESTYSSLSSKPKRINEEPGEEEEEEEDKSFLLALPTRDFTRSPSQHSMNVPSPISASSRYSATQSQPQPQPQTQTTTQSANQSHRQNQGHMRSPSTPSPLPSNSPNSFHSPSQPGLRTHMRSPSSPAEFSPSPLSPSPNAPIQRLRRPSLLSNRSNTIRPPIIPPRSSSRQFSIKSESSSQVATCSRIRQSINSNQTPFHATLLEDNIKQIPNDGNENEGDLILLNLEFAYSLDNKPNNEKVIIPIEILENQGENKLLNWIERYLHRDNPKTTATNGNNGGQNVISTITTIPEMTDGESAEESDLESDNGLTALLRDEYLNSFILPDPPSTATSLTTPNPVTETVDIEASISISSSPTKNKSPISPITLKDIPLPPTPASTLAVLDDFPTRPPSDVSPKKEAWKRGVTPRQYAQLQGIYPTPLSSLAPTSQEDDEAGSELGNERSSEMDDQAKERNLDMKMDKFHWIPPKTPPLSIRRHSKSHLPPTPTLSNYTISPTKKGLERERENETQGDRIIVKEKKLRELKIFLTREAGSWHRIAHRLLSGKWGKFKNDDEILNRIIDELDWVGMIDLKDELLGLELEHSTGSQSLSSNEDSNMNSRSHPPPSLSGIISNKITNSPQSTSGGLTNSMSAGFIGFTPLSGSSPNSISTPISGDGGGVRKITRSSSSTSLMMLRSRSNRVSGVNRGGSGYI